MKKLVLFVFLILSSCSLFKYKKIYEPNSKWKFYYNSKNDTSIVYIDRIDFFRGIIIRDTKIRIDSTIYGKTKSAFLYPIYE